MKTYSSRYLYATLIITLAGILVFGIYFFTKTQKNTYKIIQYTETTEKVTNPFRGFYHHTETHSYLYSPIEKEELSNYQDSTGISLILRVFYLEDFVNKPISEEYIKNIEKDLETARSQDFDVIMRFAYTDKLNETPPYGDAEKEIILEHIEQLTPVFQKYSDVIAALQAGFIGTWGEWYYTDHFADPNNPSIISADNLKSRKQIIIALLNALPKNTFLQLRTPEYKLAVFQDPLTVESAFKSEPARIGFHNDCFLASENDFGTFSGDLSKSLMANDTRFTPMGGETCNINPPRTSCETALEELKKYHWSYLNIDYHPEVLNAWIDGGCFPVIEDKLGYRFVLQRGGFSDFVAPGEYFELELEIKNDGWASPYKEVKSEIILVNSETNEEIIFPISEDLRFWEPSDTPYKIKASFCIPQNTKTGNYNLYIRSFFSTTGNDYSKSINFANEIEWDDKLGLNSLNHRVIIKNNIISLLKTNSCK